VVAVIGWEVPFLGELPTTREYESARVESGRHAEMVVRDAIARVDGAGDVEVLTLHGAPAAVLAAAAEEADLLVVGSRGRGGFAGLLLGSVSARCAQLGPCPVVIVPGDKTVPA
jgi:nucleotide-binding universal stress UspA family protein